MSTTTGARIKLIPYGDEPRKPAYALILGLAILISLGSMVMVVIEGSMRWVVVIAAVVLLGFVAAVIDARMTRRG